MARDERLAYIICRTGVVDARGEGWGLLGVKAAPAGPAASCEPPSGNPLRARGSSHIADRSSGVSLAVGGASVTLTVSLASPIAHVRSSLRRCTRRAAHPTSA